MANGQCLKAFEAQRQGFRPTTYKQRRALIDRFHRELLKWRPRFQESVAQDLRRIPLETDVAELLQIHLACKHAKRNLKKWMKPKHVSTPLVLFGSKSQIVYEPKGVVLVISPWNYPLALTLIPILDALAAGNRVIIKPSELTPATSETLRQFVAEVFTPEEAVVFTGGSSVSTELLELPFDHIIYTGGPAVAKIVMSAAAKNLTPVTLELGGKSPVFVDKDVNIKKAAERIVWGKRLNSGQTCLAPDYVLVDRAIEAPFLEAVKNAVQRFESGLQPIINERHFGRIHKALQDSVRAGARIEHGGESDLKAYSLSLTVLSGANRDHAIMKEEIFGPVLPILTYESLDEALDFVRQDDKPLALYAFSRNRAYLNRVVNETQSGAVCLNEAMVHFANSNLPFGGIGLSGMGQYHGEFGFQTFSHQKAVVTRGWLNFTHLFYPPYKPILTKIMNVLFRAK